MVNTPISLVPNGQAISGATAAAVFTLDQCTIGATTPKAGTFTTLIATTGRFTTVSAATPILVSNGGTGLATLTANNLLVGAGASTPTFIAPSTSGNVLTSNGTTWVSSTPASSSGNLVLLSTLTASSSATIDFTSTYITSTYKKYIFDLIDVVPASDAQSFGLLVSEDNGSNYKTGGTDYESAVISMGSAGVPENENSTANSAKIFFPFNSTVGNDTGESLCGTITLFNPAGTTVNKRFLIDVTFESNGGAVNTLKGTASYKGSVNAINAVRFLFASGNIASGTFKLYGVL